MSIPRHVSISRPTAVAVGSAIAGGGHLHGRAHLAMRAAVHAGGTPVGGSIRTRAASRSCEGPSDARFIPVGVAGLMVQLHQVPSSGSRAFGDVQFPRAPKKTVVREERERRFMT